MLTITKLTILDNKYLIKTESTGINEYHSKEKTEKVGPLQTMEHDKIEVENVLNHFCEDRSRVSDVRRLGKRKSGKKDQRPRPLVLSLTSPWTVRKLLSRAYTMNDYNKANNCEIYVGKLLIKGEQELERKRLSKRWKLINEISYSRESLKICNLKLYNTQVEMNINMMNNLIAEKPFNGICWSNVEVLLELWYDWLKDILQRTVPKRAAHRSSLSPGSNCHIQFYKESRNCKALPRNLKSNNFKRYMKKCWKKTTLTLKRFFLHPAKPGLYSSTIEHFNHSNPNLSSCQERNCN